LVKRQSHVKEILCHKCGYGSILGTLIRTGKDLWVHKECPRDTMNFLAQMDHIKTLKEVEPDEPGDQDSGLRE